VNRLDTLAAQPLGSESLQPPTSSWPFYRLTPEVGYTHPRLFQVIAVSQGFFHIREAGTGQVKGFRCTYSDACALAEHFEKALP